MGPGTTLMRPPLQSKSASGSCPNAGSCAGACPHLEHIASPRDGLDLSEYTAPPPKGAEGWKRFSAPDTEWHWHCPACSGVMGAQSGDDVCIRALEGVPGPLRRDHGLHPHGALRRVCAELEAAGAHLNSEMTCDSVFYFSLLMLCRRSPVLCLF